MNKCSSFCFARRVLALLAFISEFLLLYLLLSGFIPFYGRNMTLISSFNSLFEFLNIGRRSFIFCISSTIFSAAYIAVIVRIVLYIIDSLRFMKKWLIFQG